MSETSEEGLRFILAGPSIVSDLGNPAATTNRAVMTALIELGHEATYLEPRHDEALIALLRARGSEPMRAFLAAYPALQYRTVDLPQTFQASSWAGQFLATASAAVTLIGCPEVVAAGFQQFTDAGVRYFREDAHGEGTALAAFPDWRPITPYQPAVLPKIWNEPRHGTLMVAYDNGDLAREVAALVQPDAMVVSGTADLPDWEWVPEVDLPERYGRAARVVVTDRCDLIAPARVWLARANGATAWGVVLDGLDAYPADVAVPIGAFDAIDWNQPTPISAAVDVRQVAARLANETRGRMMVSMNGNR